MNDLNTKTRGWRGESDLQRERKHRKAIEQEEPFLRAGLNGIICAAFEAYSFHVKDRWCSASCLCLHHAAGKTYDKSFGCACIRPALIADSETIHIAATRYYIPATVAAALQDRNFGTFTRNEYTAPRSSVSI